MEKNTIKTETSTGMDRPLFIAIVLLLGFGLVMIYSASAVVAAQKMSNAGHFFNRQLMFVGLGMVVMLVSSRIDYHIYQKWVYPLLCLSLIGLVLCHAPPPIGRTINYAARWIGRPPLTIQPGEIVKVALVLWLSYSLAKKEDHIKTFSIGFLPHLLVPGFAILLCLSQPDFGTSVVIATMVFSLLFIAGAKIGYMLLAGVVVAPIGYYLVVGTSYRMDRILAYMDPLSDKYRYDLSYQLVQSMYGFGAGGVTGVGLGDGMQKMFFLPEAHNDFILAIVGEELGVIGVWTLLLLFVVLIARGVLVAMRAPDRVGTYTAFGLTVLVGFQALTNMGVAMGLVPTKGLNLPLVSYGGSALVITMFSMGILLNISRRRPVESEVETHAKSNSSIFGNIRRVVATSTGEKE